MLSRLCKLHGKRKVKTYNRFTKAREKGSRAQPYGKSRVHEGGQKERKKGTIELRNRQKAMDEMAFLARPYISLVTLHVNTSNSLTKRHRVGAWIKKKKTQPCSTFSRFT